MPAKPTILRPLTGLLIGEPDKQGKTHVALTIPSRGRKTYTKRDSVPNGAVSGQTPYLFWAPEYVTPGVGHPPAYWLHMRRAYVTSYPLTPADVKLLLTAMHTDQEDRRRADLDRALALAAMVATPLPDPNRPAIPVEVKRFVWQRDGGRCVLCGGTTELQFGHIIPFSWGGSNTEVNLQLECAGCNLSKGADL